MLERRCVMNYELYQKKYQYERLINVLQNNYNNLNDVYYSLISCRKIIKESIEIDGVYYNKKTLDNMIKKIEDYRSLIINTFIPQARYQYNIILNEISKI